MTQLMKNQPSQWWWLESHSTTKRSPWFQSTLNELNEKTKAMLKLIEEDADSFAKRAEMYYKKRPELISMVEDFYRTHRSLAESYDQVKPDTAFRQLKIEGSQPCSPKKLLSFGDNGYDNYSENCDVEESVKSEVDDPEKEEEDRICDEVMMLREEVERLRKENRALKDELKEKDEEKIKVIRQMSLAIDFIKQENVKMRSFIAKESKKNLKTSFDLNKLMGALSRKLGIRRNQPSVIAL
ncbi:putative protein Networked (NET), actin-binding (NAB) [Lupinus albus]|uniref:NAB domain-containing protein n=1 Tax=Lupinus albus TaxID=3870 RepID=A0A6A4QC10_LUPAL|nr:putative protein Networked (NET), actin-binding (NAB) [Lupinus albus]